MTCRSITFGLLVASLSMPVGLHGQSLGEVAKKAQERRNKAKAEGEKAKTEGEKGNPGGSTAKPNSPPAKAYTNKDLTHAPARPVTAAVAPIETVPAQPAANDTSSKITPANAAEPVKDEAWWRSRMIGLRADLTQATNARVAKVGLVMRLQGVRANVPDRGFRVAQANAAASSELAKARADLEVCLGAEKAAKVTIAEAEEEARRLGVLPGWLR